MFLNVYVFSRSSNDYYCSSCTNPYKLVYFFAPADIFFVYIFIFFVLPKNNFVFSFVFSVCRNLHFKYPHVLEVFSLKLLKNFLNALPATLKISFSTKPPPIFLLNNNFTNYAIFSIFTDIHKVYNIISFCAILGYMRLLCISMVFF